MMNIALTGGIASGKSTVSEIFRELGVPVIDADEVARDVVKPGTMAYQKIVSHFGETCRTADGTLNRSQLRDIVFHNATERVWLEKLLHPLIVLAMHEETRRINAQPTEEKTPYCILVIPLLAEMELHTYKAWIQHVLVVDCPEDLQKARLRDYKHWDEALITNVLQTQSTRAQRLQIADDVIHNNGDLPMLKAHVLALHQKYIS